MVRALCFDLMGTLVHDPYREAVRAATGLELDALEGLKDPHAWPAFEVGEIDAAEFARRFFADPGRTFDLAAFDRVRRERYTFLPGIADLLDDTDGLVERYVASNYPVWVEELAERFDLHERFEGVWSSHHLGVRKPDPAFYERLLEGIGHAPEQCLFVDDREENCAGARAVGMRAHRYRDTAALRLRLRAEGVAL